MRPIEVEIIEHQDVYMPNDEVVGMIRINPTKPLFATQITVSLRGITQCRFGLLGLESLYSTKLALVNDRRFLLEKPQLLKTEESSWPFKFVLPETSQKTQSPFKEPSQIFVTESEQPLPPTFIVPKREKASSQDSCSIIYDIHVTINNGKGFSNLFRKDSLEYSRPINFRAQRHGVIPDYNMVMKRCEFQFRKSLLEMDGFLKKSLTLKERVYSTLSPHALPSASMDVTMNLPRALVLGRTMPLILGVSHDIVDRTTGESPEVELKTLLVKLEAHTVIRGLVERRSDTRYLPASHSAWRNTIEISKFSGELLVAGYLDLRPHMPLGLPKDLVPTFGTFNIARTYSLFAEATVECAGETFKASFDVQPKIIPYSKYDEDDCPNFSVKKSFLPNDSDLPTWEESVALSGLAPVTEGDEAELPPPQYA